MKKNIYIYYRKINQLKFISSILLERNNIMKCILFVNWPIVTIDTISTRQFVILYRENVLTINKPNFGNSVRFSN